MRRLRVLQSIWAMERRHADGVEPTLEESVERIVGAGFDGISITLPDAARALKAAALLDASRHVIEGISYPTSIDALKPDLETATKIGVTHLNLQPNVRPRRLEDCRPYIEGWLRLAEQVDFPVYFETHRDRMTTDLYFTLDLLELYPELPLVGDLSHFLVGREFAWPVSEENHAYIQRILENCWAFHGRVASREQVQIEITYPDHRPWVDLFVNWWERGFASFINRSDAGDLCFTCELGPRPYAIINRDGEDSTDRWAEALLLKEIAAAAFERVLRDQVKPTARRR